MATLSAEVKRFIVQQLACFESPSDVVKAVKAEFGITVSRQAVQHYDPEAGGEGKRLAKEHKELFEATRRRFIEQIDAIGVSHKAYRLAQLQHAIHRAKGMNNFPLLLQALEHAAKEAGGLFTNKRELTGRGGEPLVPPDIAATILKVYGDGGSQT